TSHRRRMQIGRAPSSRRPPFINPQSPVYHMAVAALSGPGAAGPVFAGPDAAGPDKPAPAATEHMGQLQHIDTVAAPAPTRRPRFRRAAEPPPFRLTDDDVEIVRAVARHRLITSTNIATLVGRSLDRTNDRLLRLFHAGYVDRPRAQLDRFPTSGT